MDNVEKLQAFIDDNGLTHAQAADAVGCSRPMVTQILGRRLRPGLDLSFEIEAFTKKTVKAKDWRKDGGAG